MPVSEGRKHWFQFLFGDFRPWERAAIDAWLREADPAIRVVAQRQLELVIRVARLFEGREVYPVYAPFFLYRGKFPDFPNFPLEKQVAEVRLSVARKKVRCQIWVVRGHIAIMEFARLPRGLPRDAPVEALEVKTGPFPTDRKGDELAASLPADYVEIARVAADELEREDIRVLTLDQIYTVNVEDGEYWLLAEKPDFWMLGARTDSSDRDVWLLSYGAFPPERLSPSFREALEKARELE